jgi:hypothetical protein
MNAKHQNIEIKIGKIPKNLKFDSTSKKIKIPVKNKNALNIGSLVSSSGSFYILSRSSWFLLKWNDNLNIYEQFPTS